MWFSLFCGVCILGEQGRKACGIREREGVCPSPSPFYYGDALVLACCAAGLFMSFFFLLFLLFCLFVCLIVCLQALALLGRMKSGGVQRTLVTFNAALLACAKVRVRASVCVLFTLNRSF